MELAKALRRHLRAEALSLCAFCRRAGWPESVYVSMNRWLRGKPHPTTGLPFTLPLYQRLWLAAALGLPQRAAMDSRERGKYEPASVAANETKRRRNNARARSRTQNRPAEITSYCQSCGIDCKPVAHHFLGYEGSDATKVLWLCRRCHGKAHAKGAKG